MKAITLKQIVEMSKVSNPYCFYVDCEELREHEHWMGMVWLKTSAMAKSGAIGRTGDSKDN